MSDQPFLTEALPTDPEISIRDLLAAVWKGRWIVVVSVALFTSLGLAYAFLAPVWYRAETTLAPAERKSLPGGLAQLGGLASLAGINLPASEGSEPLAVLKSKSLIGDFIIDRNLLPVLFDKKWDSGGQKWKVSGLEIPDVRDGIKYFDHDIRIVVEDKKTGLVTLAIRWHDPKLAAEWANELVRRTNARLRSQAIEEAQTSITYLQRELASASVISLQQSIGRVLEGQMQTMALARSNEEFAFKTIDYASAPKFWDSPRRATIAVMSLIGGLIAGMVIAIWIAFNR
jgi:uncharacterized protein involved in exopolysaccharide biosynthesis